MSNQSQLKKPCVKEDGHGSWLQGLGTLLLGIAAILEVIFKIVTWFVAQ